MRTSLISLLSLLINLIYFCWIKKYLTDLKLLNDIVCDGVWVCFTNGADAKTLSEMCWANPEKNVNSRPAVSVTCQKPGRSRPTKSAFKHTYIMIPSQMTGTPFTHTQIILHQKHHESFWSTTLWTLWTALRFPPSNSLCKTKALCFSLPKSHDKLTLHAVPVSASVFVVECGLRCLLINYSSKQYASNRGEKWRP